MFICDAHSDTLFKMACMPELDLDVTPDRLRAGGVALQTLAMFCGKDGSVETAERIAGQMLTLFERLKREEGWRQILHPSDAVDGDVSYLLALEGGEVLTAGLEKVDEYYAHGVRMISLTWNHDNALATPHNVNTHDGLKPYGLRVLKHVQSLGIAVDLSHLNEAGVNDVLLKTDIPPLASHSACRHLMDHSRNLTDNQLRALFAAGGYIGVVFYPKFLTSEQATIDTVIDHIDHLMTLGGEGMVGFGSDFDGITDYIDGLSSPLGYPALIDRLRARGYSDAAMRALSGQSFVDYFNRIQPT